MVSCSFLGGDGGDGKFAALQRALSEPYFVVLPLALMRCSIASRWLSQTASSSLCQRVAAMAQEADVALYRVQERALRPKRWKLKTRANARDRTALRNRFAAMLERLPPFADESAARSDVVKSARNLV